jgi:uncharacterized flavoprotein (TIGR03862 family)
LQQERKQVIIIGGGPAGLKAAEILSLSHNVSLYDKEKNIGQKFLLAGKSSINLTNSLQGEELFCKYSPVGFMNKALSNFDSLALRQWFAAIGISTFIGSSGRVFPGKGIKAIDILNKIKARLINQGVQFFTQYELVGLDNEKQVIFKNQMQEIKAKADYLVLALGGASWPVTGSNGLWCTMLESVGISTNPFQSSNCGINILWSESIRKSHAGKPVKNIKLFTNDTEVNGEVVLTHYGMEGNAAYSMVPSIRKMLNNNMPAYLHIDFKPSNTREQLLQKVRGKAIKTKDYAELFNLSTVQLAIIKSYSSKDSFLTVDGFIGNIKKLTIPVDSLRPIEEAISTIGGINLDEINDDFSLKKYPWIFVIGEMLDWDAPTGGFLLQGCFSMGNYAAKSILEKE